MDLYFTRSSPYALCVRMVITELDITQQIRMIESHPFQNQADFLRASPLGKVPCLIDVGETIVDSEVICDYLDANFNNGELFNPVYADWRLKSCYSMISGLIDCSVARRIEYTRQQQGCFSEFWWQRQSDALARTLNAITPRLTLFPKNISVLHMNLLCALRYLDFRHQDIDWRSAHADLANFFETWSERPCVSQNPLSE